LRDGASGSPGNQQGKTMTFNAKNFDPQFLIAADHDAHADVRELTGAEQDLIGGGAPTTEYSILIGL
jgi:hypothetical protein